MTLRFYYDSKLTAERDGRRNLYVEVENARGPGSPFIWQSEVMNDQAAQEDLEAALAEAHRVLGQLRVPYTLEPINKKREPESPPSSR